MLKNLIAIIFSIVSFSVFANDELLVHSPWPVGSTPDNVCRTLFKTYSQETGINHVIITSPGADGMISHRAFNNSQRPGLFCSGKAPILNAALSKDIAPPVDNLKFVTTVINQSWFLYTPLKGAASIDELVKNSKSSGKPIIYGSTSNLQTKMMSGLFDKLGVKYEAVIYRKLSDAMSDLADARLDLYVEGGTFNQHTNRRWQEIAHVGTKKNISTTENLFNRWPEMKYWQGTIVIYARNDMPNKDVELLNQQLRKVIMGAEMAAFFNNTSPYHEVRATSLDEGQQVMKSWIKFFNAQQ